MGSREEPNWLLSVKGQDNGTHGCGNKGDLTLPQGPRNWCKESPALNPPAWPWAGLFVPPHSQNPKKKDEDDISFRSREEGGLSESLPYLLSLLS